MFLDPLKHFNWRVRHLSLILLEALNRDSGVKCEQPAGLTHDYLLPRHTVDLARLLHQLADPELTLWEELVSVEWRRLWFHSRAGGFYFGSQVSPHGSEVAFGVQEGKEEVMVGVIFRQNVNSEIDRYNIIRLNQLPQLILIHKFILMLILLILCVFIIQKFDECLEQEYFAHHP